MSGEVIRTYGKKKWHFFLSFWQHWLTSFLNSTTTTGYLFHAHVMAAHQRTWYDSLLTLGGTLYEIFEV